MFWFPRRTDNHNYEHCWSGWIGGWGRGVVGEGARRGLKVKSSAPPLKPLPHEMALYMGLWRAAILSPGQPLSPKIP